MKETRLIRCVKHVRFSLCRGCLRRADFRRVRALRQRRARVLASSARADGLLLPSRRLLEADPSFFDYKTSCASILFAELAATLVPDSLLPAGGAAAEIVLRAAPALTAILEGAIGPLLVLMPPLGILFGLAFHLMINVLPLNCTCTSCVMSFSLPLFGPLALLESVGCLLHALSMLARPERSASTP